jgi:hypothetical protein
MAAPKARVMQQGSQGLLDYAINQGTSSGRNKRLEDYPSQARVDEVGARFTKRLNSLGYKATLLSVHPTNKEFNHINFTPSASKPLPGRDTYLKGYDAMLVVDMPAVGQSQLVYGFVPLSDRKATAAFQGSMFSIPDGKRTWRSALAVPNYLQGQPTQGSSDDISNVFHAIDLAVNTQSKALEDDFFKNY